MNAKTTVRVRTTDSAVKEKPKGASTANGEDAIGTHAIVEAKHSAGALTTPAIDFSADAGKGTEGVDKDSQAIPFLAALQALSPAVADELVPGAKPGLLINTVTNELFDKITVVPVAFQRRYVQWAQRSEGGGYKGEHKPLDVEAGHVGYKSEDGRYLVGDPKASEKDRAKHDMLKDTRSHFVIAIRPDGSFFPALMPLASTQIKKSKKWISMIMGVQMRGPGGQLFNPASFSHMYTIGTVKESNDQGSWHGITVEAAGPVVNPEVYAAAKALYEQFNAGKINVAEPDSTVGASDEAHSERNF